MPTVSQFQILATLALKRVASNHFDNADLPPVLPPVDNPQPQASPSPQPTQQSQQQPQISRQTVVRGKSLREESVGVGGRTTGQTGSRWSSAARAVPLVVTSADKGGPGTPPQRGPAPPPGIDVQNGRTPISKRQQGQGSLAPVSPGLPSSPSQVSSTPAIHDSMSSISQPPELLKSVTSLSSGHTVHPEGRKVGWTTPPTESPSTQRHELTTDNSSHARKLDELRRARAALSARSPLVTNITQAHSPAAPTPSESSGALPDHPPRSPLPTGPEDSERLFTRSRARGRVLSNTILRKHSQTRSPTIKGGSFGRSPTSSVTLLGPDVPRARSPVGNQRAGSPVAIRDPVTGSPISIRRAEVVFGQGIMAEGETGRTPMEILAASVASLTGRHISRSPSPEVRNGTGNGSSSSFISSFSRLGASSPTPTTSANLSTMHSRGWDDPYDLLKPVSLAAFIPVPTAREDSPSRSESTMSKDRMSPAECLLRNWGSPGLLFRSDLLDATAYPEDQKSHLFNLGFRDKAKFKALQEKQHKQELERKQVQEAVCLEHFQRRRDVGAATSKLLSIGYFQELSKKYGAVPKFSAPPESQPAALCFSIKGSNLTHLQVKRAVEDVLHGKYYGIVIRNIKFELRSAKIKGHQADNRWIITLNDIVARNRLSGTELKFDGVSVPLKRYDDVMAFEYRQYERTKEMLKMVNKGNRKKQF